MLQSKAREVATPGKRATEKRTEEEKATARERKEGTTKPPHMRVIIPTGKEKGQAASQGTSGGGHRRRSRNVKGRATVERESRGSGSRGWNTSGGAATSAGRASAEKKKSAWESSGTGKNPTRVNHEGRGHSERLESGGKQRRPA